MSVEIISKKEWTGDMCRISEKWHIKIGQNHFIVSAVQGIMGTETYVFKCDEKGEVTDWGEVVGIKRWDHEEAIKLLREILFSPHTEEG